ncbi:MAG TPA: hypothetical protein ENJ56_05895 [Anaerolineae bacterium]|nr:hypothetical protein [Anaerolineae bacterium]
MPIQQTKAPVQKVHKSIRLDIQTVFAIEQTAKNMGLNFSRTLETLVRLGLQDSNAFAAAELQRTCADQGVSRALNRYLKLLSQAVIAANEAKEMAQQNFMVQLCYLAERVADPDQIDFALSLDPASEMGEALIQVYKQRLARGRNRAVRQLKRAINIDAAVWAQVVKWREGRDEE